MKKATPTLAFCLAGLFLVSAVPTASAAPTPQNPPEVVRNSDESVWMRNQRIPVGANDRAENARGNRDNRWRNRTFGAPEINPSLLAGGLALLIGGTFVLLGQRRASRSEA
jgi:hypothetical protein